VLESQSRTAQPGRGEELRGDGTVPPSPAAAKQKVLQVRASQCEAGSMLHRLPLPAQTLRWVVG